VPHPPPVNKSLLYRFCQVPCRVLTSTMFDLKVYGLEHVPRSGGVLLLSNHQSYLDPVLVAVRLDRPVSFLAKSELFEPWGLRWVIRSLGAFPIRQGAGDIGAVREMIAKLNDGHVLNAYPEGTRTPDGSIKPFQNGFALVVRRVDVPIVPVAITGSHQAWPRGRAIFHPAPIRVKYGPPVPVAGLKPTEIVARVESAIHRLFDELRQMERDATEA
jgi:1-acyl-sn-glycerol-3-phosphate acyltransferase